VIYIIFREGLSVLTPLASQEERPLGFEGDAVARMERSEIRGGVRVDPGLRCAPSGLRFPLYRFLW